MHTLGSKSLCVLIYIFLLFVAAGKSTFLRLLEESNPAYRVVSEPLTRWLNIPSSEDVSFPTVLQPISTYPDHSQICLWMIKKRECSQDKLGLVLLRTFNRSGRKWLLTSFPGSPSPFKLCPCEHYVWKESLVWNCGHPWPSHLSSCPTRACKATGGHGLVPGSPSPSILIFAQAKFKGSERESLRMRLGNGLMHLKSHKFLNCSQRGQSLASAQV